MTDSYRFYGPAIGESIAIVDANVVGVTPNGTIEFEPHNNTIDTIGITSDRLKNLVDENKAYALQDVNTDDPIWDAISDVESRFQNANDDKKAFVDAVKILFLGAA